MKHYEAVAALLDHIGPAKDLTGETAKAVTALRRWLNRKLESDRRAAEYHERMLAQIRDGSPIQDELLEAEEWDRRLQAAE